jgi:membrane associated rhomboid family serine protease
MIVPPGRVPTRPQTAGKIDTHEITHPDGRVEKRIVEANWGAEIVAFFVGAGILSLAIAVALGRIEGGVLVGALGAVGGLGALWMVGRKESSKSSALVIVCRVLGVVGFVLSVAIVAAAIAGYDPSVLLGTD